MVVSLGGATPTNSAATAQGEARERTLGRTFWVGFCVRCPWTRLFAVRGTPLESLRGESRPRKHLNVSRLSFPSRVEFSCEVVGSRNKLSSTVLLVLPTRVSRESRGSSLAWPHAARYFIFVSGCDLCRCFSLLVLCIQRTAALPSDNHDCMNQTHARATHKDRQGQARSHAARTRTHTRTHAHNTYTYMHTD